MNNQHKEYESGKVVEILDSLGYSPIQDCGDFIRTRSIYRGGDATNSLKVWKNSGYCVDYAANDKFNFYELVKRTLGINDPKQILSVINAQKVQDASPLKEKTKMSKIYEPDCLSRLFPNYSFYDRKRISDLTQKTYKVGLASTGKMYQRMVFPIFNEYKQIFGFSGRHIAWSEDSNCSKWKHLGQKSEWIYPYYTIPECRENTPSNEGEIILVESIGDSMALFENNIKNHLVTFGLECSPSMISFLLAQNPNKIIISTNDDAEKEENRGKVSAIKSMMKLSTIFPIESLEIKLPLENDFGRMQELEINFTDWQTKKPLDNKAIAKYVENNREKFDAQKTKKFLKKL